MKHIKRKFSNQIKVDGLNKALELKPYSIPISNDDPNEIEEGMKRWMITSTDVMFEAFAFEDVNSNRNLMVPEPNPILVYFNTAQINYRLLITNGGKKELLKYLKDLESMDTTKLMHLLYNFLGESSSFIIFLFMAIECAVNKSIPDDFTFSKEEKNGTMHYNPEQVQKLEFKLKIREVLFQTTGKQF